MSLPVVFRQIARTEYDDAATWYELQLNGLGDEFEAEIEKVLITIADFPSRYPVIRGEIREAPISRFPYCIYYRVRNDRVVVIAVFHQSRNPSEWQERA